MYMTLVGRSPWFGGLRAALAAALRERGHFVHEREGMPPTTAGSPIVVLGPHDHGPPPAGGFKIAFWTEQPGSRINQLRPGYRALYDAWFEIHRPTASKEDLPHFVGWSEWEPKESPPDLDRPIECLWYGANTARRAPIVEAVGRVCALEMPAFFLKGEEKRHALSLAKTVLHVHAVDEPSFPSFRFAEAAASGAVMISEEVDDPTPWVPGRDFFSAKKDDLPDLVRSVLSGPDLASVRASALARASFHGAGAAADMVVSALSTCRV